MSKLTKFLLEHGTLTKTNPSGSSYYLIGGQTVRLSNHLSQINVPNLLSILLPQGTNKQYVVVFLDRIYVHVSYTSLRVFLEHYLLISKAYALRQSVMESDKVKAQTNTINMLQSALAKAKSKAPISITGLPDTFTKAQKAQIALFIKQNQTQTQTK